MEGALDRAFRKCWEEEQKRQSEILKRGVEKAAGNIEERRG